MKTALANGSISQQNQRFTLMDERLNVFVITKTCQQTDRKTIQTGEQRFNGLATNTR